VVNLFPPLEPHQFRALQIGIAASVLLHALVLFVAPGFRAPPRQLPALPTLSAVLRSPPPSAEPASAPKAPAEPVREAQKPPPEPKAEPPRPKTQTPQLTTQTPQPQAAPAAPTAPAPVTPAATAPAPVTASETKAGSSAAMAQPPPVLASSAPNAAAASSPADPDAVQAYLVHLAANAQKYELFPEAGRGQHWQGIATLRLTIGANGRIRDIVVVNSSGHEEFDKIAIGMIRKGAPLTEIKPELRGREFSVDVLLKLTPRD
jgi:protein TonB